MSGKNVGMVWCRKYSDVTEVTEFDSTSSNKSKDLNQSTASVEAKSGTTARSFFCACNFNTDMGSKASIDLLNFSKGML